MGDFFGSMYCWFEDLFGIELANYLWGQATAGQQTNMFIGIGLSMFGVSLLVAILYYYVINHPRLNTFLGWAIFLVANAAINFLIGWQWVLSHYYGGKMKTVDQITNQEVDLNISASDCFSFGVTNMILSLFVFLFFSYIIKWWSSNCSRAPF